MHCRPSCPGGAAWFSKSSPLVAQRDRLHLLERSRGPTLRAASPSSRADPHEQLSRVTQLRAASREPLAAAGAGREASSPSALVPWQLYRPTSEQPSALSSQHAKRSPPRLQNPQRGMPESLELLKDPAVPARLVAGANGDDDRSDWKCNGRMRIAGEWSDASSITGLLVERQSLRALHRSSDEHLWRKWQLRASFDLWHRRLRRTNRRILERLHQISAQDKGRTPQLRAAMSRWIAVCDQLRSRQLKKLQQVAELRLTMLMTGLTADRDLMRMGRQLTVRWRHPLAYKTFQAWRRLTVEQLLEGNSGPSSLLRAAVHHKRTLLLRTGRAIAAILWARSFRRRAGAVRVGTSKSPHLGTAWGLPIAHSTYRPSLTNVVCRFASRQPYASSHVDRGGDGCCLRHRSEVSSAAPHARMDIHYCRALLAPFASVAWQRPARRHRGH